MTAADINLETLHLENLHRAILAAWRIEQPRLITSLARMLRDVPLAEDVTQEALVAALEHWPVTGIPEKPGAWLMASAKNRALDHLRRGRMLKPKHDVIAAEMAEEQEAVPDFDSALDDDIGDEMLRLIFTACHPLLAREARAALALRMVCGLTTEEIARAFLQPAATIGQRTAARGADWLRPQLCHEALRLGRVLTAIAPHEPEAFGLLALMELNASRTAARTDAQGEPILLLEQNRGLWDQLLIRRGLLALGRARELGGAGGNYALQAAIVACHAGAATAGETDWPRIAALYAELAARTPSPIVELNRAVAVGMAEGPEAGLIMVDRLAGEAALKNYHLLPTVRGDLLHKLGRYQEAAAALTGNKREHDLLKRRAIVAGLRRRNAAYRGANTMTTWRPSKRGSCSIFAILSVSPLTRSSSL
jgi:RNA polymerase sigma factor (sigma-70 family)